jgi:hypothetical protein
VAIIYRAFLILYGIVLGAMFVGASAFFIDHWTPGKELTPGGVSSAPQPPLASNEVKLRISSIVQVSKILPADASRATVADGSSFCTAEFQAPKSGAPARVRVTAYASAVDPNVAVLAVFLTGQEAPVGLVSKPVSNNNRELIELVADIPAPGTNPLTFDFRIGPATPGTIIFNGPEGASVTAATVITITE